MLKKIRIGKGVKIIAAAVVLLSVISFAERKQGAEVCKDIVVKLDNQYDNFFIDENDIIALMTDDGDDIIIGKDFEEINLKTIEERVRTQKFLQKAEIYKDLKGNILVNAKLRRPFARIVEPSVPRGYISTDGVVLPPSSKYTSRTIILSGSFMKELVKSDLTATEEGQKIYELLKFIDGDKFWKAQIAQIDIDKKMNVLIYPQVTKQIVEFGQPDDLEAKFKKLKVFYKQILPQKGWNTYERVNLKYKDQIIAE
ncbi:cell division protein FtsQ/DivIB [Fulvivirga lutimaris]|uniref:cell division protein FtsQ/DivIB n=1 Tax=Fulvivirga lutimaris TaxID=1819566 RepID=UPI0012BC526E|nr:cell division protein FtsQ [Fulvivirga lutimaris]MTI41868.1 cell division protein FtsQ [Fulvivirga lutimaris]